MNKKMFILCASIALGSTFSFAAGNISKSNKPVQSKEAELALSYAGPVEEDKTSPEKLDKSLFSAFYCLKPAICEIVLLNKEKKTLRVVGEKQQGHTTLFALIGNNTKMKWQDYESMIKSGTVLDVYIKK